MNIMLGIGEHESEAWQTTLNRCEEEMVNLESGFDEAFAILTKRKQLLQRQLQCVLTLCRSYVKDPSGKELVTNFQEEVCGFDTQARLKILKEDLVMAESLLSSDITGPKFDYEISMVAGFGAFTTGDKQPSQLFSTGEDLNPYTDDEDAREFLLDADKKVVASGGDGGVVAGDDDGEVVAGGSGEKVLNCDVEKVLNCGDDEKVHASSSALGATYNVYAKPGPRRLKPWLILVVLTLVQLPIVSTQSVSTLFQMNHPLCWGPALIGVYLTTALFIIQAGSFFGSVVFIKCLRLPNIVVVIIGDLSGAAGHIFYSMCVKTWQIFISPVISMFGLLPLPMSRAIASNLVDVSEQGGLFSGMSIISTLASICGSLAFNTLYTATLAWFHGTVFMLCGAIDLLSFVFAVVYFIHDRRTSDYIRLRSVNSVECLRDG